MIRIDFNQGWLFSKAGDTLQTAVTLPHDAMIHENRSPDSPGGSANAYFPGGRYIYEKTFTTLAEWQDKTLILEFEGVYRNSSIYLNDRKIGGRNYGYIPFHVDLTDHLNPGATNTLRVEVDNSQLPNSRWYSGSGIYRPVSLLIGGRTHIQPEGVRITTLSLEPAVIRVETEVTGGEVIAEIYDGQYKVASGQGNAVVLKIENASLWSAENPHCYTCRVMVSEQGDVVDEATVSFGIRTISWSPAGLQINGKETKLRGACVHHDNGLLGAVSYPASEERRVRILRQAGYNALRISHNPASRSLLEACDRLGLYVIDETWDMWYIHKNKHDYATDFMAGYQDDIRSLVARDYNHPSVIMYSIGNEVTEPYEARGVELTRSMVDLFHQLDSTRAVTGGINLMIISLASKGKGIYKEGAGDDGDERKKRKSGSLFFNMMAMMVGTGMNKAANTDTADRVTSPCLDALDIAGYNYASGRYKLDGRKHPNRVIFGSETFPQDIYKNWAMVQKYPYLVGDFMWTGWDYLGEAGIGAWSYDPAAASFEKPYPWLLAGSGAIDILGRIDAEARYAAIVWGLDNNPFIGVRPVNKPARKLIKSVWRWTNARDSWSWRGCDGNKAEIEVYSNADTIQLELDGRVIGKKKLKACLARFRVKYAPGTLKATAYDREGRMTGQSELTSATGAVQILITPETPTIKTGVPIYVSISLVGENGVIECNADQQLKVTVEGGRLLGFGSANPCTEERFDSGEYTTWYGQAQAVLIADHPGQLTIHVTEGKRETSYRLQVGEG